MMAFTHFALGTLAYAGMAALFGGDLSAPALAAAALGSLLPDIDTPSSRAGMCVYPLASWLEKKFGHRTLTHSLVGVGLCALFVSPLLLSPVRALFLPVVCGFAFHLLGDVCTKAGIPMLWPRRERWVFPGNAAYRLKTGGRAEWVVLGVAVCVALAVLPIAQVGPRRWLHVLRGDIGSAVRDQQDYAGRYATQAQVEGYDLLSHRLVSGRFPVVGLQGDDGLLIERGGALWVVSKSASGADPFRIEPRSVRVYAARPLHTRQVTLPASNLTLQALCDRLVSPVNDMAPPWESPASDDFLMSDIRVSGVARVFALPKGEGAPKDALKVSGLGRVELRGELLTLREARLFDLRGWGVVTIRSASLMATLPQKMRAPDLLFAGENRVVEVPHLRHRSDLSFALGQLVHKGQRLGHPFAQTPKAKPSPRDLVLEARAREAQKQLLSLDAEANALRKSELWSRFAEAFAQRRANLKQSAAFVVAPPKTAPAPAPVLCPWNAVVESVEWEAPSTPDTPDDKPENLARLTLAEVATQ